VKVVLDSNVLLAGFTSRGLCEAVVVVCLNSHELILSRYILDELQRHLKGRFKMPAPQADQIVRFLSQQAKLVGPLIVEVEDCPDKDDLPILGTALAAGADCLVTGDQGLLKLQAVQGIAILSPRSFHDRLT
jgi:uncharacterized protein